MNQFWIFLSTYSGIKLEIAALLIFLIWTTRLRKHLLMKAAILLAVFMTFRLIGEAVKLGIAAPRPCWQAEIHSLIHCPESFSFPSGHALGATMAAVIMGLISRKKIVWLMSLLAATLISISRVTTGVHWPIDVVGGGTMGAVFGWLAWRFYWK